MLHSEKLLDHFENPRNAGDPVEGATTVEVSNPVCGDILRLSVRWEDGVAREARFKARGCVACVGAGSVLTELLIGRSRGEARAIGRQQIDEACGGLINESKHVAVLCEDAVRALLKVPTA